MCLLGFFEAVESVSNVLILYVMGRRVQVQLLNDLGIPNVFIFNVNKSAFDLQPAYCQYCLLLNDSTFRL